MQNILVAPNKEILETSKYIITTDYGFYLTDSFVCPHIDDLKKLMKKVDNATFILTHCFLIPWTVENLNFIVNVYKQKKVSVYCLDLKMSLTTDVYGRPIADVLSYLNLMKLYNVEFQLGMDDIQPSSKNKR